MSASVLQSVLMRKTASPWGSMFRHPVRMARDGARRAARAMEGVPWQRPAAIAGATAAGAGIPAAYLMGKNTGEIEGANEEHTRLGRKIREGKSPFAKAKKPGMFGRAVDWASENPWTTAGIAATPVAAYALWKLLGGGDDEDE